jgi:acyl carrier protein
MTTETRDFEGMIRGFICSELGYEPGEIGSDTLLFSTGMVDSFTFVGMIALLETELGTRLDPRSITVENFDSIDRITAFLRTVER